MKRFFKIEWHYFAVTLFIAAAYVFYMHFAFDKTWSNSENSLRLINFTQKIVPAIGSLPDNLGANKNYWKLFFSLFWLTTPIYWVLGYLGTPWLSAYRRKKFIVDTTMTRVIIILLMLLFGTWFALVFPILNGMNILNETSNHLPILLISWWYIAGLIYCQAKTFRASLIKIHLKPIKDN